ncbi:MAG: hypothetical protein H6712_27525 [Myxococcales bacterium]|nr:hypothetical protein [Myxococcales bacterium]MCB9717629.1 hypothetical protein [Myxococcales bacterium]
MKKQELIRNIQSLSLDDALELRREVEQRIAALALEAGHDGGLGVSTDLRAGAKAAI